MKKTLFGLVFAIAISMPFSAKAQIIENYDSLFFQMAFRLAMSADSAGVFTTQAYYLLPKGKLEGSLAVQRSGDELVLISFFCEKDRICYGAQCDRRGITFSKNTLSLLEVKGDESEKITRWKGTPTEWQELPEDIPPEELIYLALTTLPKGPSR